MLKLTVTNAVVTKGYNGAPAIQMSESGSTARFRIGCRVFDKQADGNYCYLNLTVKAFGNLIKKITDMKLAAGSYVNLAGRFDEDTWTDPKTNETRKFNVVILDEIEYAAGKPSESSHGEANQNSTTAENRTNFTGYEPFGTSDFFDD